MRARNDTVLSSSDVAIEDQPLYRSEVIETFEQKKPARKPWKKAATDEGSVDLGKLTKRIQVLTDKRDALDARIKRFTLRQTKKLDKIKQELATAKDVLIRRMTKDRDDEQQGEDK